VTRPIRHIVQHLTVERAALALSVAANLLVAIYLIAWQPSPRLTADLGLRTDRVIEVIANRLPTADGERLRTIHAARAGELAALDTAFRAALIDAHDRLLSLGREIPYANFDPGLTAVEIGGLLAGAATPKG